MSLEAFAKHLSSLDAYENYSVRLSLIMCSLKRELVPLRIPLEFWTGHLSIRGNVVSVSEAIDVDDRLYAHFGEQQCT